MRTSRRRTAWTVAAAAVICGLASAGCDYVIPPVEFGTPTPSYSDSGWAGIVTNVTESSGSLHVDLAIANHTNDWSAMDVGATTASVVDASGSRRDCNERYVGTSVFVNSAGWYLPPGFVMRGYTGGSVSAPVVRTLYVECAGVSKSPGQVLSINYSYITGAFNYFVATRPRKATMRLELDKVVTDTEFPIGHDVEHLPFVKPGEEMPAINGCTVRLVGAKRTETGFQFDWDTFNPTKERAYVHIGIPPVIGSDGILYGFYKSPHLADVPITPAGGDAVWTTTATVPSGVSSFYLLVPVESQQAKYFIDYVVDISDL